MKSIYQSFATDAIDLIADDRMKRPRPAFDDHAKPNLLPHGEFFPDTRKCLFQIKRTTVVGAKTLDSVSGLVNDLPHQSFNIAERWL